MTKTVKDAIQALHELPEERQETVAQAILDYAHDDVYRLTDEERVEIEEGLDEVARGDIASENEVQTLYKRMGI